MEDYEIEEYRDDFKLLLKVKDIAEHLHYKTKSNRNIDVEIMLEEIIKNADEAIIHIAKDFSDFGADIQPVEGELIFRAGKFGYAFNWLLKLQGAIDDTEREEILQNWLAELQQKKTQSEND